MPPHDLPTLLLDENLSSADIGAYLRKLKDWQIELHTDHFLPGVSDPEVIQKCAENNWILISCDDRIRYVPQNKAAVFKYAARVFMFNKGSFQGVEYSSALVVARTRMFDIIRKTTGPFLARIQIKGEVNLLEPQPANATTSSLDKTTRKYGVDAVKKDA